MILSMLVGTLLCLCILKHVVYLRLGCLLHIDVPFLKLLKLVNDLSAVVTIAKMYNTTLIFKRNTSKHIKVSTDIVGSTVDIPLLIHVSFHN